jgi:large subunit ribosomal protein L18
MKLDFGKNTSTRVKNRLKNKVRIRRKLSGTESKPRFCVFKSSKHIYAQLVDDVAEKTLVAQSTLKMDKIGNCDGAKEVGRLIAEAAKAKNLTEVVFDRSGYKFHGKVKAVADGAREAGLKF